MALPVTGKVILDTNVFIDHLRADLHADWVFGRVENVVRFLSSVVLMELRLGAGTLPRRRAVDRIKSAFPASRLVAPAPTSTTVSQCSSGYFMATATASPTASVGRERC
jgi:predicted nucleic acid-binding protein